MSAEKEITIYDLARELNVSPATISRGLKDSPSISKATKKKIHELALLRGFRINNVARSLRQSKSHIVGVMMHELNTSFMVSVLSGIEDVLSETEYDILITHSGELGQREIINAKNLFNKRVDGLIASLAADTHTLSHFTPYFEKKIPIVFFDRVEASTPGAKVVIDNYDCGYRVTEHLIQQGCTRILHLTRNLTRNVYQLRYDGYRAALRDNGLKFYPELVMETSLLSRSHLEESAKQILEMKPFPDGLFAAGDFAAAICLQTFKDAGLTIPRDIAIAGFNNDAVSTLVDPHLTTINYSGFTMGQLAAKQMLDQLNGKSTPAESGTVVMDTELIVRASSIRDSM